MSQLTQSQIKRVFYKRLYHLAVEMDSIAVVWDEIKDNDNPTKQDHRSVKTAYDKFLAEIQKKSKP